MKKLVLFLATMFLCLSSFIFAGEKQLTLEWEQTITDDFAGWTLYHSLDNSTYEKFTDIDYIETKEVYTTTKTVTSPDGEDQTHWFYMTARDNSGNESERSNIVSEDIDFESPNIPYILTITIEKSQETN